MTLITDLFCLRLNNAAKLAGLVLVFFVLTGFGCQTGPKPNPPTSKPKEKQDAPKYSYEVVNTWPHDAEAFTQGLVFYDGNLLESTGRQGRSSLRRVELDTGKVLEKVDLPGAYFGEGITVFKGKIYQLTWQDQRGFIYDAGSFKKIGEFTYTGEGWGLTNDGESLILSDGTNRLKYLDPDDFHIRKSIAVLDGRTPVTNLNELEYAQGEIYANIWHQERVARIDPQTGRVSAWIDLTGLLPRSEVNDEEAVLNGIAFDETNGRLFVTGKLWPKLFEIRLKRIS